MILVGRLVLLVLFVFAVYLPLRGWHSWRRGWRYIALLPVVPLLGLAGYVTETVFLDDTGQELSPELMVLVVIGSLLMSAVIGFFQSRSKD